MALEDLLGMDRIPRVGIDPSLHGEIIMRAYSQDLRDRVLKALERGERPSDIARRFEVSRVWVYQVLNRLRDQGERCSHQVGTHRQSCIAHLETTIRAWVEAEPSLTLAQLSERLALREGVQITMSALWQQLKKWKLGFKKTTTHRRTRAPGRPANAPSMTSEPAYMEISSPPP